MNFFYFSPLTRSPFKIKFEIKFIRPVVIQRGRERNLNHNFKIILNLKEQFLSGLQEKALRG